MKFEIVFSKLHFFAILLLVVLCTLMALNEDKTMRIYLLIAVLVVQHLTSILFMLHYETMSRKQWKIKEEKLRAELQGIPIQQS
jgi:hypothetical protein